MLKNKLYLVCFYKVKGFVNLVICWGGVEICRDWYKYDLIMFIFILDFEFIVKYFLVWYVYKVIVLFSFFCYL